MKSHGPGGRKGRFGRSRRTRAKQRQRLQIGFIHKWIFHLRFETSWWMNDTKNEQLLRAGRRHVRALRRANSNAVAILNPRQLQKVETDSWLGEPGRIGHGWLHQEAEMANRYHG